MRERVSLVIPDTDKIIPTPVTQAYEAAIGRCGERIALNATHGFLWGRLNADELARAELERHLVQVVDSLAIGT